MYKNEKYKILSFSTTMRNPQRIANFLKALLPFENHLLTHEFFAIFIAPKIYEDSKRYVKFIKFDEGLEIKNMDILEFIQNIKIAYTQNQAIKNLCIQRNLG